MAVVINEVEVIPDTRRPEGSPSTKQDDAPASKKPEVDVWQTVKQRVARDERLRAH